MDFDFDSLSQKTAGDKLTPAVGVSEMPDFRKRPIWTGNYYSVQSVSNSFMQVLYEENNDFFVPDFNKENAFAFGSAFHEYVLESLENFDKINFADIDTIKSMQKALFKKANTDNIVSAFVHADNPKIEFEHYAKMNGLYVRCKSDMELENVIFELKSTSSENEKSFKQAIDRFGYQRAAAFYMDIAKKDYHYIIAVSKKHPHRIFTHVTMRNSKEYVRGRKQYLDIMSIIFNYYKENYDG